MDAFAAEMGCRILTLPTGQGLLIKPRLLPLEIFSSLRVYARIE